MPPAMILLEDTLTFLAFLHGQNVRPLGVRWLPPTALRELNAQLCEPDRVAPPSRSRSGKRGTTERETQQLRFVHFLCEAASLVARTGPYLKPTLRVKPWLAADPFDQLRQLFAAAYPDQPSRSHDERWRTYCLPGWSLSSPTLTLIQPLMQLLRAAPPGERLKLTTLLKLIPLPDDGDEAPAGIVRGVLDGLHAFGVVAWHSPVSLTVTDLGRSLLHHASPAQPVQLVPTERSATLEIARQRYSLALPNALTLYALSDVARLVAVKPRRRYRLDRLLIQRSLQRGHSLDGILRFLEAALGDALPDRLVAALREWAAPLDQVAVRRVTVLEVKDPATLADLTRSQRVRESIQRTLSPRVVVVRESRLPALLHQLDRRGLTPRTNLSPRRLDDSTTRLFDNPALAQLYFAALLNHDLSDRLPAPYRIDYSHVLELQRQITLADQILAAQLAEEAAAMLQPEVGLRNESRQRELADSSFRIPHARPRSGAERDSELTSTLSYIEQAIAANTPLTLTYYSPAYDQTTNRIVEPLRLEWRGDIPYLIAYCRLRQDERVFRVERILTIEPLDSPPVPS